METVGVTVRGHPFGSRLRRRTPEAARCVRRGRMGVGPGLSCGGTSRIEEVRMRTERTVAILSLALLGVGACGKRQDRSAALSDDLKRDLAAASATSSELAIAPANYQRMRFVSDIEQSRATVRMQRPKVTHHSNRMTAANSPVGTETDAAPDAMSAMASHAPAPVSTPELPANEPIVIAARPAPEPS